MRGKPGLSRAARMAPRTTSRGARSPPIASMAIAGPFPAKLRFLDLNHRLAAVIAADVANRVRLLDGAATGALDPGREGEVIMGPSHARLGLRRSPLRNRHLVYLYVSCLPGKKKSGIL